MTHWPWWWSGLAVGAIALGYPWLTGRTLGVSGIYGLLLGEVRRRWRDRRSSGSRDALAQAMLAATLEAFGTETPSLQTDDRTRLQRLRARPTRSRPLFLIGIIFGGALASVYAGAFPDPAVLGERFHASLSSPARSVPWLFVCGMCIGVGARWSGGCTSGHGITGVAAGERGSIVSTATFWTTGVATAWLCVWMLGG